MIFKDRGDNIGNEKKESPIVTSKIIKIKY